MNNEYTNTVRRDVVSYERGTVHGRAEASWIFDGNTTIETYKAFLRLYNDNDLPDEYCPRDILSGEWAGESIPELLGDLLSDSLSIHERDSIYEHYEQGYQDGWYDKLEEISIHMTQDLDA